MELHEQALNEALALIDRMQADSAKRSVRQVQVLRETLDAAMQSAEAALAGRAQADRDNEVASAIERVSQAATGHAQALVDRAKLESQAAIESVRVALAEQTNRNAELTEALDAARTQAERLRGDAESEADRAQAARAERALADAARAQAEAAQRDSEAGVQRETQARVAAEEQLEQVRQMLEAALAEVTTSSKQLDKETAESARLTAALARLAPQPFDALMTTYQSLENAATADDLLVALVNGVASDFSRVALFRVNAHHLEGVHQIGFNFENDISKVVIPLTIDSLLSHAVASGRVEGFSPHELPTGSRIPFSGAPTFILTLPVIVRGETLAVIYADDSGRAAGESAVPERSLKFVQLLLWHAVPRLTRLSTDLIALTELRQYATMLVNEIGHIYNADAGAGKKAEELQARLRDNLQCARQIFAQRVTPEGPFAATLLEEQLALQGQTGTPFGRDVSVIIGRSPTGTRALEAAS